METSNGRRNQMLDTGGTKDFRDLNESLIDDTREAEISSDRNGKGRKRLMEKRKSVIAVSFIAAFLFLLVVRLVNEVNFPLLLNCFGQPGAKWIPFSYTYRRPLRTHYGYINVRTQESAAPPTSNLLIHWLHVELRKQLHVFLVVCGITYISFHLETLISSYQLENWLALFLGGQLVGNGSL
ncbi:hypothetical protein DBR06_SOUSAS8710013 [Sousa chinensis]|nr:hypothetical protein DBR06_SOUSAS8710013 [Sousa chinensis]